MEAVAKLHHIPRPIEPVENSDYQAATFWDHEVRILLSTVEPLLKDSPNKGHHRNYLPTKDTVLGPKNELSYVVNTFLTSEEWTTSLQWTN